MAGKMQCFTIAGNEDGHPGAGGIEGFLNQRADFPGVSPRLVLCLKRGADDSTKKREA